MDEYKSRGYHIEGKHVEYWIFALEGSWKIKQHDWKKDN
jgi:hypothetical protein